ISKQRNRAVYGFDFHRPRHKRRIQKAQELVQQRWLLLQNIFDFWQVHRPLIYEPQELHTLQGASGEIAPPQKMRLKEKVALKVGIIISLGPLELFPGLDLRRYELYVSLGNQVSYFCMIRLLGFAKVHLYVVDVSKQPFNHINRSIPIERNAVTRQSKI